MLLLFATQTYDKLKVALDASDNSDSVAHSLTTYPFGQGLIASARTRCTTLQKASVHAHKLDNALNEVSDALDAVYNIDVQDWVLDREFSEDLLQKVDSVLVVGNNLSTTLNKITDDCKELILVQTKSKSEACACAVFTVLMEMLHELEVHECSSAALWADLWVTLQLWHRRVTSVANLPACIQPDIVDLLSF